MSKRMGQTGVLRSGLYLSPVQSLDLVGWQGTVGIGCVTTISVFISPGESAGARNLNKPPPFRPSTNTPISLLRFTQDGLSTLVLANARARLLLFSSMAKWKLKRMLRRITRRSGFSLWTLLSTKVVSALLFSKGSVYQGKLRIATVHFLLCLIPNQQNESPFFYRPTFSPSQSHKAKNNQFRLVFINLQFPAWRRHSTPFYEKSLFVLSVTWCAFPVAQEGHLY